MGQHFFLLFLSLHAGFISTIQANELEAGIIYSNQQGMTLKLHQNKEFEYLLGNFQHSILISGKYDIIAMGANDQIICRIEARSLLSDQKNRDGYDYLWGSDSLKFGFIHENAISPIGGEGQLNVSPILYKIRDRSATYVERTSYANRKEGIVFIETETDTSSFLSCYSFDEKEGRNGELLWKLKLPLFGEKKENDGVSYAYYSQLAEYAVLGGDLLQAAVYYDSSFAFLAHPLASDLYNAALLSLALGDQLKSEEYLKALQLKGISLDRISKKSNLIRDFLSHSRSDVGSSFNTEIQRIEQYSSHTKNEYFRMFFRDLEANDQFYRKKKKLKEYRDKLSQIDSLNQAQLIRFYELYGFPREQELQDYHKDKEPVFSSFPGLIVNVHNTYYGDYQLKDWVIKGYRSGYIRADYFAYLIDLEAQRKGDPPFFGVPVAYKVKGKFYVKEYDPENIQRINENRRAYGLMDYQTHLQYFKYNLRRDNSFPEGFTPKTLLVNAIEWRQVNVKELITIWNLKPL